MNVKSESARLLIYSLIKKKYIFLFIIIVLSGCDGYRHVKFTFNENKSNIVSADTDRLFEKLTVFMEDYSEINDFTCSLVYQVKKQQLCGGRSITLEVAVDFDKNYVTLRIAQFGPVGATKDYEKIRDELLIVIPENFPMAKVSEIKGSH
jgi:hypothetical protein